MKKLINNVYLKKIAYIGGAVLIAILVFNYILMPWYVSAKEVVVPKVTGLTKEQAEQKLSDNDLNYINAGERYDERYAKGKILFQKPVAGSIVKEGRRVFLIVSSGIPTVKVPSLIGKFYRDALLTLEKMNLAVGDTTMVESELPKYSVIDQQYYTGRELQAGTKVNLKISSGLTQGLIPVPDLLGKSLAQAEKFILDSKLTLGRINYQPSFSLLPNTIIDQYPSKETLVKEGSSVDIFVTKDVETPEEVEEKK
jgi:eukaryotic-like serine/threonine-protein kinase